MFDVLNLAIIESIIRSSDKIADAISSLPSGSFELASYSGFLSGISAFVAALSFDYFKSKATNKKNKKKKIANIAYKTIESFENEAVRYWLQDKNKSNYHKQEMLEISMKLSFLNVSNLIEEIKLYHKLDGSDLELMENSWYELYDIAMGGDFEVHNKKSCKNRAVNIVSISSKIKLVLLRYDY